MTMHHFTHRTLHKQKKHELDFESLPHPHICSHTSRNGCVVGVLKSNEEVKWETEGYFGGFDKSYHLEDIEKLILVDFITSISNTLVLSQIMRDYARQKGRQQCT